MARYQPRIIIIIIKPEQLNETMRSIAAHLETKNIPLFPTHTRLTDVYTHKQFAYSRRNDDQFAYSFVTPPA